MRSRTVRVCAVVCLALAGSAGAASEPGRNAVDVARDHLQRNPAKLGLAAPDVGEIAVSSVVPSRHNGVTHVYFLQLHQGIEVHDAVANVNVGPTGEAPEPPAILGGGIKKKGDDYHFNWKTDGSWENTCRRLTLRIPAPSDAVAYFSFH